MILVSKNVLLAFHVHTQVAHVIGKKVGIAQLSSRGQFPAIRIWNPETNQSILHHLTTQEVHAQDALLYLT